MTYWKGPEHAARISAWERAKTYFECEPLPRSKYWQDPMVRPLITSVETGTTIRYQPSDDSYHLQRYNRSGNGGIYGTGADVVLHKPADDGTRVVEINRRCFGNRISEVSFVRYVMGIWDRRTYVPAGGGPSVMLPRIEGARLVLTADGKLVQEKSTHLPVGMRRTSKEHLAARKAFDRSLDALWDMLPFKMHEAREWMHEHPTQYWELVREDSSAEVPLREYSHYAAAGREPTPQMVDAVLGIFMRAWGHVFNGNKYSRYVSQGPQQVAHKVPTGVEVPEDEVRAKVMELLGDITKINRPDLIVPLPMWQRDYPKSCVRAPEV